MKAAQSKVMIMNSTGVFVSVVQRTNSLKIQEMKRARRSLFMTKETLFQSPVGWTDRRQRASSSNSHELSAHLS